MGKRKKIRTQAVYATTAAEVTEISVELSSAGDVRFPDEVIDARVETSYDRCKGPKVLHRIGLDPSRLHIDPNVALYSNFDLVFAVDTNTRSLKGFRISVTGVIEAVPTHDPVTRRRAFSYRTPFCLEFMQVCSNPEQLGWISAAEQIEADPAYRRSSNIALIVDSDLQNLPSYNARSLPIHGGVFLPKRFTLIYATSDAGSEFVANGLLRYADRSARQVLDALEHDLIPLNEARVLDAPYAAIRRLISRGR